MSTYMQPFPKEDIKNGTKILVEQIQVGNVIKSCSYVNSTAYWFQVQDKSGNTLTFIAPNSKGNDTFTLEADDRLTVLRDLSLPPVTSAVSTDLFWIRFNNRDASSGISDFNASTALGSDAAQDVVVKTALPAGNNTIGTVGLTAGSSHIGSVDIDDLPAVDIASVPDVGIKPGQSVNVGTMPDVGIKAGQSVGVTGSVDIGTMPDVGLKSGQTVNIGNLPTSQDVNVSNFPSVQAVRLQGQNNVIPQPSTSFMMTTLTVGTADTDTAIPAKTNGPFIFRADPKNQGTIYFGPVGKVEFPLEPGAAIDGHATWGANEMSFKGETVGDKLYLLGGVY